MLNAAGLSVIGGANGPANAALRIQVNGEPIGHEYRSAAVYTGAKVGGFCALEANQTTWRTRFKGQADDYADENWLLDDRYRSPRNAPFAKALGRSGYVGSLAEVIAAFSRADDVRLLVAALRDKDEALQWGAGEALSRVGERAVGPLLAALPDLKWVSQRAAAGRAMGSMGELARGPLLGALKDANAIVREVAAVGLGEMKASEAVGPLIAALKDKGEYVRLSAARALGQVGDPKAVAPLAAVLKDEHLDWRLRAWALHALQSIGASAVDPLIEALKNADAFLKAKAAKALGEIGDPKAIKPLAESLRHPDGLVYLNSIDALAAIDDPKATAALIEFCADCALYSRDTLARALAAKGQAVVPALVAALETGNSQTQQVAVDALGQIGGARAIEALIATWSGPNTRLHLRSAMVLRLMGKPTVPFLIKALDSSNWRARWEAAGCLGVVGDGRALKPLSDVASRDPRGLVRQEAGHAVSEIKKRISHE